MAADTLTREEQISRYVRLDAADLLLSWLVVQFEAIDPVIEDDIHVGSLFELRDELWDRNDDDAPRAEGADARTELLLARAFARLATDEAREFFLERSAYFAALAEKSVAELVGGEFGDAG